MSITFIIFHKELYMLWKICLLAPSMCLTKRNHCCVIFIMFIILMFVNYCRGHDGGHPKVEYFEHTACSKSRQKQVQEARFGSWHG
jgi:hypothetical protein